MEAHQVHYIRVRLGSCILNPDMTTGVLYEFITVSVFYWIVAASIAELASAIPSSGGVYHWASVTAGRKWGRVNGGKPVRKILISTNYLQASLVAIGTGWPGSSDAHP